MTIYPVSVELLAHGVDGMLCIAALCKGGDVDIRIGCQVLLDEGFVLRPIIAR